MQLYLMIPRRDLGGVSDKPYTVMEAHDPRREDPDWYELDPGTLEDGILTTRWNRYKVFPDMTAKAVDKDGNIVERIGSCHVCKKAAAVNTPAIDPKIGLQESPIWCDNCAKDAPVMLVGIDQTTLNGQRSFHRGYGTVYKSGIVVHLDAPWESGGRVTSAWFHGGRTAIPKAREKAAVYGTNEDPNIEQFLDAMADRQERGLYYCTKCGDDLPEEEIAGRPLFAGLVCSSCNEEHKQHLSQQRKAGHVCRRCNEPYDNCCC